MSAERSNPFFVGRERELEWLGRLTQNHGKAIIVAGARGVGKTSLVMQYLYSAERLHWVRWDLHPDPASFEALRERVEELYDKIDQTEIVVIDNAQTLSNATAGAIVDRILNLKRIRAIILISSIPLEVARAETIVLPDLGPQQHVDLIYDLDRGLLVPDRQLIADVGPRLVLANQSLAERLQRSPQSVLDLSPRQFEELVADLLHDLGCEVHITPATRDGGKDILAYMSTPLGRVLCLVEAKRYRRDRTVGVDLVRQLYGTLIDAGASNAMLVTTSSFSKDARAFRQKHEYRLDLRDYASVVQWIKGYRQNQF